MPPNYPHKLTKAAEPWLGGGAASGGSNCTPAARRLQVAPAAPRWSRQPPHRPRRTAPAGRCGGPLSQRRVITLAAPDSGRGFRVTIGTMAIPTSDMPGHRALHDRVVAALDTCVESQSVDFKESATWEALQFKNIR